VGWAFTSASLTLFAPGIYRLSLVGTCPAATTALLFIGGAPLSSSSRVPSYTGTSSTIICGFPQMETGSFPTSYIQTFASTVTRAADNISLATSAFPASVNPGTMFVEYSLNALSTAQNQFALVQQSDGNNYSALAANNTAGSIFALVNTGGVGQGFQVSTVNATAGDIERAAFALATNDTAYTVNGEAVITDATVTLPTVTRLDFGSLGGTLLLNGCIRKVMVLPRRMTNAELQTLTT
jgi:hypothetical protein